ncbi:MAG: hypothetical protein U0L09_06865 [Christensenellales bacterium]|nr:hypothetical protein [Christensenellales bacterium]
MSIRKILCLVLALTFCSAAALAETDLDAANARIAELEALVELYKPFYDAQIVAEYDGGIIFRDDALEEYEYAISMYSQYGIDVAAYGLEAELKQLAVEGMMQKKALEIRAAELGLDQLDEEVISRLESEAEAGFESYIEGVKSYVAGEETDEEKIRQAAIDYLTAQGYTLEKLTDTMKENYVSEQIYNDTIQDVSVSDEDVQAYYDSLVKADQESYANESNYYSKRQSGSEIYWNPEGYRQIKQTLIKFSDEQAAQYSELKSTLTALNSELDALLNPPQATEAPAETVEATVPAESAEPTETPVPRTEEEIRGDIAGIEKEIDALYESLMPTAQEVVNKFNEGTSFAELVEEYNQDAGMQREPTKTIGYAVSAASTVYDPAFTEAAMSIEAIGGISEPARGNYGIYVLYYEADITPGAVPLEGVRETVEKGALENKRNETYQNALKAWVDALHPVYHLENL